MMMMARMIWVPMLVRGAGRIAIAEDNAQPPVDRCQHEPSRYERAEREHGERQHRSPVPFTFVQAFCSASHALSNCSGGS
jgi:hypothetical protein